MFGKRKLLKKNERSNLAPIAVKILLYWGSIQKIATDSGTSGSFETIVSASNNYS